MTLSKTNYTNKLLSLTFVIISLVLFYRRPDAFYHAQFYGDEGGAHFKEAYEHSFSCLFSTWQGYYHLVPRLFAYFAVSVRMPLEVIPFLFTYAWLAIFFFLIWFLWKRIEFNDLQKLFLSIAIVLVPLQSEVFMNQTNMQWVMVLFPIIIFSSQNEEKNNRWFYIDVILLVLSGFTGPNFIVLLPLFIFLLFSLKNNSKRKILYLLAIITGVIGVIALSQNGVVNRTEGDFTLWNKGFIQLIFVQYAFLFIGKFSFLMPFIVMSLGVIGILLFFVYAFMQSWKQYKQNCFLFICLVSGLLFLAVTLVAYRNNPSLLSPYYRSVRNFYIPALLFVWALMWFVFTYKNATKLLIALMLLFSVELILFVGSEQFERIDMKPYSSKLYLADSLSMRISPEGWAINLGKPHHSIKQ